MRLPHYVLCLLLVIPVAIAYYFAVDRSVSVVLQALVSTVLWVVFIYVALTAIRRLIIRRVLALTSYSLLAVYCGGLLLSFYLQGEYFNRQFFFHLDISTLTETWSAFYRQFLVFLLWFFAIWLTVWKLPWRSLSTRILAASPLILAMALLLDPGLRSSAVFAVQSFHAGGSEELQDIDWEGLRLNEGALTESASAARAGKNLVLIFMEGLERLYTDESVFPGLTPNLNALAADNWQLTQLTQSPGTSWTMGGLVSSLCGTPLLYDMDFGGNLIMTTNFLNRAQCLPDVLNSAGYRQTFMGGASLEFAGKGLFLRSHSFNSVLGRFELQDKLLDRKYMAGWGLFDDSLLGFAVEEFERLASTEKPFNLTVLTVDTHHPSGEPSKSCPRYSGEDNSILHSVHCTDFLVGQFVDRIKDHPAFADTVVVLVSDHLAMRNKAFGLFPRGYPRRLFFTAINSAMQGISTIPAVSMDIAPTVLSLLEVDHSAEFLVGEDLTALRDPTRDLLRNNLRRNQTIANLNSNHLTADLDLEREAVRISPNALEFNKQITDVRIDGDALSFEATGRDPHLFLPVLKNKSGGLIIVSIDLEVPVETQLEVYYHTRKHRKYDRSHLRNHVAKLGRKTLKVPLPADADSGRIRIDPGHKPGRYTIYSIDVQL